MTLNEIANRAYDHAVEKGFHPNFIVDTVEARKEKQFTRERQYLATRLLLIHSEVTEIAELLRKEDLDVKEVSDELADVIIRTADLAFILDIDLDRAVKDKMDYNDTRPYRHGRRML